MNYNSLQGFCPTKCPLAQKNKDGLAPILVLFRSIGGVEHAERMERLS